MQMHQVGQSGNLSSQDLRRYFGEAPSMDISPQEKGRFLLIGLALVAAFLMYGIFSSISGCGLIIAIGTTIAIVMIVKKTPIPPLPPPPPVPTDKEYEDWVRSWQDSIRQYGMQRLGLDKNMVLGKPLYIRSLVWPDSSGSKYYRSYDTPIIIKYGANGRPHSSINRYTFFYPTQHYIAVFIGDINALDRTRFEGTRTYFYDDIVGVETSAITLNDEYVNYAMQHFELRVSSGQSIGATTYVHDLDVDQTVNALRTLLRDKKYGTQGGGFGYAGS